MKNVYQYIRFTIIMGCAGGEDLCLDQNLPRTRQRRDWPFSHVQSHRQCVLGAGHEIPYAAKRL